MADRKALYMSSVGYAQVGTGGDFLFVPGLYLADDTSIVLGNTSAAPNAEMLWETADANANALLVVLPVGGVTDVPAFIVGDTAAKNKDLGLYNGLTAPSVIALDATATKGTRICHNGTYGYLISSSGDVIVSPGLLTGTLEVTADSGAVAFVNMAVSSTPAAGTEESLSITIDSSVVIKAYAESDAAGGIQNARAGVNTVLPKHELDITGGIRYSKFVFVDDFESDVSLHVVWVDRVSTGTTQTDQSGCLNGILHMETGEASTNEQSVDFGGRKICVNTLRPEFEVYLKLGATASIECEFGLIGADADDYVKVIYDASVDGLWRLKTSKDGASTNSDDGAAASANWVVVKVIWLTDTSLEWFLDGVSQGTITTAANIPTAAMQPYIAVRTEQDALASLDVDYYKLWQDRT